MWSETSEPKTLQLNGRNTSNTHLVVRFGGDILQRCLLVEHKLQNIEMDSRSTVKEYNNQVNEIGGHLAS